MNKDMVAIFQPEASLDELFRQDFLCQFFIGEMG